MTSLVKFWKKDFGISRKFKSARERSLYALTYMQVFALIACLACIYSLIEWYRNRKTWFIREPNEKEVIDIDYEETE